MSPRLDEMLEDGHLDITFSKQGGQKLSKMTAEAIKHNAYLLTFNQKTNDLWLGARVIDRIDGGRLRLTIMSDTIPKFKEAVARQEIAFALAIPSENHEITLSDWSLRTMREIQIKRQKGMRNYPAWVHQPSRLTSDDMKSLIINNNVVMDGLLHDHRLGMLELTNKGWQKWRWLETEKAPNPIPQVIFLQKDGTPILGASTLGSRQLRHRVSIFMSPEAIQKMIRQP